MSEREAFINGFMASAEGLNGEYVRPEEKSSMDVAVKLAEARYGSE